MPDLKDQLRLEDDLVLQGADRFFKNTKSAEDQGRGSDTGYGNRLLMNLVVPVAEHVEEFCNSARAKRLGKYAKMIKGVDPTVTAYVALKTILDSLHIGKPLNALALEIGLRIEDEIRFSAFKDMNAQYYNTLVSDFQRKNTKSYRHVRNVLAVTSKKKGLEWDAWSKEQRLRVGSLLVDCVLKSTDIIRMDKKYSRNKSIFRVVATTEAIEWIEGFNEYSSVLHPYTKPCIIPPDDWTGMRNGGYWSEPMRHRTPFVKGLTKSEEAFVSDHDMTNAYAAVNSMQQTPWKINEFVLKTMQQVWDKNLGIGMPKKEPIDIPKFKVDTKPKEMDEATFEEFIKWKAEVAQLYTEEISRSSRSYEIARVIAMARGYKDYENIYFVYQCDFRGRVYASSSGLNPQGADFNRALLRLGESKPITEEGLYWLKVHAANSYGIDKVSFDERVAWTDSQMEYARQAVLSPVEHVDFWGGSDHPYMFLSTMYELVQANEDPLYMTSIPVGMDGSCNGIQNFSALLRDKVGGEATNLLPGDKPADIYQEVADRALELIKEDDHCDERTLWLAFADKHDGIPRSIAKRPVMTLPYGSTRYSCFDFIGDAIKELDPDFFADPNQVVSYMTYKLWAAIEDVVVAARHAMDWLQELAVLMAEKNMPVWWVNPIGFPVYQNNCKTTRQRVRSLLLGGVHLSLNNSTNVVSPQKQKQGIAPNFVHSLDSAHMMLTINKAKEQGINNFAMVHDDFGTHACDIPKLRNIIREEFVEMYKHNEPLHDLYISCALVLQDGAVPVVPEYGDLDLEKIIESEYFFG